jgi:four helix bundle protein
LGEKIRYHTDLEVYQLAFEAAMQIFETSKVFPKEETYSLTDQIRRSSRSVCANLSEAWRKRRYQAAFNHSLNLVEAEAAETQVWLSFSKECAYLSEQQADDLILDYDHILGIIVTMINHPEKWII